MATVKTKRAPRAKEQNSTSSDVLSENNDAVSVDASGHVGDVLRAAREERNTSIEMVADELMIRRFYLEALEKGAFGDLPERVYALGFVKNYANYLGLDPKTLMEQFKRDAYGARHASPYQVTLNMPEPVAHSVVPNRSAIFVGIAVLVIVLGGVVWFSQNNKVAVDVIPEPAPAHEMVPDIADIPVPAAPVVNQQAAEAIEANGNDVNNATAPVSDVAPTAFIGGAEASATENAVATDEAVQEMPVAENAATASTDDATNVVAENTDATPASAVTVKNHRILEAVHASWVEVRDEKNTILFTSILKKGQILPLPDGARLTVTTGNAGGLRMLIDGKPQPLFGQPNEVKRNMVIAPRPLDRH